MSPYQDEEGPDEDDDELLLARGGTGADASSLVDQSGEGASLLLAD